MQDNLTILYSQYISLISSLCNLNNKSHGHTNSHSHSLMPNLLTVERCIAFIQGSGSGLGLPGFYPRERIGLGFQPQEKLAENPI